MRKIVFLLLLISFAAALKVHRQIAGGWSDTQPIPEIDNFIRSKLPVLANAQLASCRSQVVAGFNYEYTYKSGSDTWKVLVFDQPWSNVRYIQSTSL